MQLKRQKWYKHVGEKPANPPQQLFFGRKKILTESSRERLEGVAVLGSRGFVWYRAQGFGEDHDTECSVS